MIRFVVELFEYVKEHIYQSDSIGVSAFLQLCVCASSIENRQCGNKRILFYVHSEIHRQ